MMAIVHVLQNGMPKTYQLAPIDLSSIKVNITCMFEILHLIISWFLHCK